jgi:hypothetical protein
MSATSTVHYAPSLQAANKVGHQLETLVIQMDAVKPRGDEFGSFKFTIVLYFPKLSLI